MDILYSFIGGVMIVIAVVGYLYINGRIAGISGLLSQVLTGAGLKSPAFWFLLGLFITPFIYVLLVHVDIVIESSNVELIIAGLLVGFGTRLGSGCTSGHGICGISRLSFRSIIATIVFMLSGIITVFIVNPILGT